MEQNIAELKIKKKNKLIGGEVYKQKYDEFIEKIQKLKQQEKETL